MTSAQSWDEAGRERDAEVARLASASSWWRGVVTSLGPLAVRRASEGEDGAAVVAPLSLVDPAALRVGDRVWMHRQGTTATLVGVLHATRSSPGWQPIPGATANFVPYGGVAQGAPQYMVLGGVTHIRGRLSPASASVASAITGLGEVGIATLPPGARPVGGFEETNTLCQGSGEAVWLLTVRPSGVVGASRYRWGTPTVNTWLPFHFAFPSQ